MILLLINIIIHYNKIDYFGSKNKKLNQPTDYFTNLLEVDLGQPQIWLMHHMPEETIDTCY